MPKLNLLYLFVFIFLENFVFNSKFEKLNDCILMYIAEKLTE